MKAGDIVVVEQDGKPPWVGKVHSYNDKGEVGVLFSPTDIRWIPAGCVRKQ